MAITPLCMDPKFSAAAAFGAPIEFCRRRQHHEKSGDGGAAQTYC